MPGKPVCSHAAWAVVSASDPDSAGILLCWLGGRMSAPMSAAILAADARIASLTL